MKKFSDAVTAAIRAGCGPDAKVLATLEAAAAAGRHPARAAELAAAVDEARAGLAADSARHASFLPEKAAARAVADAAADRSTGGGPGAGRRSGSRCTYRHSPGQTRVCRLREGAGSVGDVIFSVAELAPANPGATAGPGLCEQPSGEAAGTPRSGLCHGARRFYPRSCRGRDARFV